MSSSGLSPEAQANLANQALHIHDDRSGLIIALNVVLPLIAIICVGLRLTARKMARVKLSWDDYMVIMSMVVILVQVVINVFLVRYGIGKHVVANGMENVRKYLRMIYVYVVLYSISFPLSKLSILFLYRRVFQVPSFQRTVMIVMSIFVAFYIAQIFVVIFPCRPIAFFWDQVVAPKSGKCVNIQYLYYSVNIINIITDLILLTLPVSKIWQLQMATKQKIAICAIFLLGGFVTVCSIIRVVYLGGVVDPSAQLDVTWNSTDESIWVLVECCLGVICACLPVMWPILRKVFPAPFTSHSKRRFSSNAYRVDSDLPAGKSNNSNSTTDTMDGKNLKVYDGRRGHTSMKTAEGGLRNEEAGSDLPPHGIFVRKDFEMT